MPQELVKFNSHDADNSTMQTTLVPTRISRKSRTKQANGTLVRRSAIAVAALYTIIVAAVITAAPELLTSAPLMFLWTFTMIAATATYIAGHGFNQSTNN